MTRHDSIEAGLVSLFADEAQAPVPAGQLDQALAAIAGRRPRPARLAWLGGRWVTNDGSTDARIGALPVGVPTRYLSATVLLLLLTLALIGVAALIGGRLVEPKPEPGRLVYALGGAVYLAEQDGRDPITVADANASLPEGPSWAPDGRHFLFFDETTGSPTHVSDASGRVVATFPFIYVLGGSAWSPDSTRLQGWIDGRSRIGIYGIDGIQQASLALPPGYAIFRENGGVWAPDGRSVWVLIVRGDAQREAWSLPIDGSAPRRVAEGFASAIWGPTFTRDGTRVAYSDGSGNQVLLYVANADGTDRRPVGEGVFPVWSPSGRQLAYFRWVPDDPDKVDLGVVDADTGAARTLVGDYQWVGPEVSWSPSGDKLLFTKADAAGNLSLWTVSAAGGDPTLFVHGARRGEWQPAPAMAVPGPTAAAAAPVSSLSPEGGAPVDPTDWVAFSSGRYGFEMSHPSDWTPVPATSDWAFESTPADGWLSAADHVYGAERSIRWSALAVRVPVGMTNDDFITAFHATWPYRSRHSCADRPIDLGPVLVDGHRPAISQSMDCDDTEAFVFVDDRAYVFAIAPSAQGALFKALLSTVRFSPTPSPSDR